MRNFIGPVVVLLVGVGAQPFVTPDVGALLLWAAGTLVAVLVSTSAPIRKLTRRVKSPVLIMRRSAYESVMARATTAAGLRHQLDRIQSQLEVAKARLLEYDARMQDLRVRSEAAEKKLAEREAEPRTREKEWSPFAFYRQMLSEIITARNQHIGNAFDLAQEHARIMATIKTTLGLHRADGDLARFDNLGRPRFVPGGYDHSSPANLYQSFLIELEGRVEELRDLHDPTRRGAR